MNYFTEVDGPRLLTDGTVMAKRRNPVYLEQQGEDFTVQTNEGLMKGRAGDFVAHDPISGHVWPIAASYVEQHYEPY